MGKRKQGHTDPNSDWSKSRLAWVTQLLICFGKLPSQEINGVVPDYFNKDLLTKLAPEQIVWWDESHWKCIIGGKGINKLGQCVQFRWDENGKLDPNGTFSERPEVLNVKYDDEFWFFWVLELLNELCQLKALLLKTINLQYSLMKGLGRPMGSLHYLYQ